MQSTKEDGLSSCLTPFEPAELNELNESKDKQRLSSHGGPTGLARMLGSSALEGLDPNASGSFSLSSRREMYGANKFKERKTKGLLLLVFEQLKDPTLILLMIAAAVSTVIGAAVQSQREESGWSEGVAIWVAVLIVSFVGAGNDFQKDKQFQKLNAVKDTIEVKVIRAGQEVLVENHDVVVGDLLVLDTGDKIVADGVAVESFGLVADEASLTGESEPLAKSPKEDPWCRSGTQVTEGSGKVLVTAVGVNSEWGKTMALVSGTTHDTPLQEALGVLAAAIGKVGLAVGVLCFIVLMIRWMVENRGFPASEIASGPLQFFIFSVTIVVVAVPEGLPLAVTISLAYSMKKMMKDNNFVRVLAACETMGGATAICSDKTGTLTENRMTVVTGWFAGKLWPSPPSASDLPASLRDILTMNIALNSKALLLETGEKGTIEFVGNRTECALLMLLRDWGGSYKEIRDRNHSNTERIYGFTSERKMASILIRSPEHVRLYNKGAAEIVLSKCTSFLDADGYPQPMTEALRSEFFGKVTAMAQEGLRTLCLSYRDFSTSIDAESASFDVPPEEDLTACCIVGIKDPVREEVPAAVATCTRAGIFVRMVTGDNIHTARHIAKECGILSEDGLALEGPVFRKMPEAELIPLLPKLQVLARSSPTDKHTLVSLLRKQGEVVAVTGDGTNDAPALKEADVGLAMGIAGTEVAKEAADIVIMDDNFNSIVKSVLWGRSVFANLRKFLQFQLTINGVALVIAFVAAVTNGETPLNVLQLLWVNLIMDSLAALALATEAPTPELLEEKPHGRNEPLINGAMWRQILGQASYQCLVLFLIIYGAPQHIPGYSLPTACPTYSAVDAHGVDISLLNATGGAVAYNPTVPAPYATYSEQKARCWRGPCVNLCCHTDSQGHCTDNLVSDGGHYLPSEKPVCAFGGLNKRGAQLCNISRARRNKANFCPPGQSDCARAEQFTKLDNQGDTQYKADVGHAQRDYNSIVFNTFIFLQIFNQFNARKIKDEYNILGGIWQSRMFLYVAVIILAFQLVIMFTVVRNFFKVNTIPWQGWIYSVLIGAGAIPIAFFIKFAARHMCAGIRSHGSAREISHSTELSQRKWLKPKTWIPSSQQGNLPLPR